MRVFTCQEESTFILIDSNDERDLIYNSFLDQIKWTTWQKRLTTINVDTRPKPSNRNAHFLEYINN